VGRRPRIYCQMSRYKLRKKDFWVLTFWEKTTNSILQTSSQVPSVAKGDILFISSLKCPSDNVNSSELRAKKSNHLCPIIHCLPLTYKIMEYFNLGVPFVFYLYHQMYTTYHKKVAYGPQLEPPLALTAEELWFEQRMKAMAQSDRITGHLDPWHPLEHNLGG